MTLEYSSIYKWRLLIVCLHFMHMMKSCLNISCPILQFCASAGIEIIESISLAADRQAVQGSTSLLLKSGKWRGHRWGCSVGNILDAYISSILLLHRSWAKQLGPAQSFRSNMSTPTIQLSLPSCAPHHQSIDLPPLKSHLQTDGFPDGVKKCC